MLKMPSKAIMIS